MSEKNYKIKVRQNENLENKNNQPFNQFQFIKDIHECQMVLRTYRLRLDKLASENKELLNSVVSFKNSQYYKNYKKEYINTSTPEEIEKEYKKIYGVNEVKLVDASFLKLLRYRFELYPIKLTLMGIIPAFLIDFILIKLTHSINFLTISIGILIALAVYFFYFSNEFKNEKAGYKQEYEDTIKEINFAKTSIESNEKSYNHWKEEYMKYYNEQKEIIDDKLTANSQETRFLVDEYKRIKEIINGMYNLKIDGRLFLHPNYRGFIPISIIYGYFETGRCSQLEGHEGAYNLYEDEKMKGIIINKLDIVSKQLGQLNNSMVYVGQAIQECKERLSDLESSSNRMIGAVNNMNSNVSKQINGISNHMTAIEENTANGAYYAEVGARLTTFNTVYNLLKD